MHAVIEVVTTTRRVFTFPEGFGTAQAFEKMQDPRGGEPLPEILGELRALAVSEVIQPARTTYSLRWEH